MICHGTHILLTLFVETITVSQALSGFTTLEKHDLLGDIQVGGALDHRLYSKPCPKGRGTFLGSTYMRFLTHTVSPGRIVTVQRNTQ